MKKEILLLCIVLTASSVVINIKALSTTDIFYDNNDTIVYASYMNPEDISIYPNPVVSNIVTVTSDIEFDEIEILNIVGRSVFQKRFMPATIKATLNLQQLNKGIYLIRVNFNNNSLITEKIMVE